MIRNYEYFRQNINQVIAQSGLDVGAIYFIMKDCFTDIEHLYYAQLNKEALDESKAKKEEKENGTDS